MERDGISSREAAVRIVRRLRQAGHVAYLAGGCVRDALLGLEPVDYDIATDARPEIVRKLFPRSRYVGEAFGVCLVFDGGRRTEVATFRSEWGYHDGRRPDHVIFTDAEHDALRRDFTINGLFADPLAAEASGERCLGDEPREEANPVGRIIDYVGGVADIQRRTVRAIGNPGERFGEDYLRMLRAVRFAARLGFEIDAATAAAIPLLARNLGRISRERIGAEVAAMLGGPKPTTTDGDRRPARAQAVERMQQLRLDGVVLNDDHRERSTDVLAALDSAADYATALAAWMIDRHLDSPDLATVAAFVRTEATHHVRRWRRTLCLSNDHRDHLRSVLRLAAHAGEWDDLAVAGRKRLLAHERWPQALHLLRALPAGATAQAVKRIEHEAIPLLAQGVAPPPLVTGDDLIAMGLAPGPSFGPLLEQVYDAQLELRVRTREEALAWVRQRVGC